MNCTNNDITHEEIQRLVGVDAKLILEIGANDGEDTLRMLDNFPQATIHCFECDPRPIARFRRNVKDPRAILHEVALDDSTGVKMFHQSGGRAGSMQDWDKSGSLCVPTLHRVRSPEIDFNRQIAVDTATLDDWIFTRIPEIAYQTIDFAWIDAQGAERRIFAGAGLSLARTRFLKAECHRQELYAGQFAEAEMISFLAGWRCRGRWADDLIFANDRVKLVLP